MIRVRAEKWSRASFRPSTGPSPSKKGHYSSFSWIAAILSIALHASRSSSETSERLERRICQFLAWRPCTPPRPPRLGSRASCRGWGSKLGPGQRKRSRKSPSPLGSHHFPAWVASGCSARPRLSSKVHGDCHSSLWHHLVVISYLFTPPNLIGLEKKKSVRNKLPQ